MRIMIRIAPEVRSGERRRKIACEAVKCGYSAPSLIRKDQGSSGKPEEFPVSRRP
jgi:hypothetical protein